MFILVEFLIIKIVDEFFIDLEKLLEIILLIGM